MWTAVPAVVLVIVVVVVLAALVASVILTRRLRGSTTIQVRLIGLGFTIQRNYPEQLKGDSKDQPEHSASLDNKRTAHTYRRTRQRHRREGP